MFVEKALAAVKRVLWFPGQGPTTPDAAAVGAAKEAAESALFDPAFLQAIERYAALRQQHHADIKAVVSNNGAFQSFLDTEVRLLTRAGVEEFRAAHWLWDLCRSETQRLRNDTECCEFVVPLDLMVSRPPSEIFQTVEKLSSLLDQAARLSGQPDQAGKGVDPAAVPKPGSSQFPWQKALVGVGHGAFGLAVIGVNATAAAATLFPAPFLASLCGGLGAIACERGYNHLSDAFRA